MQEEFYKWPGELSTVAQTLLTRHEAQCRVLPLQVSLARWTEHVHIHEHHPLNLNLFLPLLRQLVTPLEDNALSIEEVRMLYHLINKLILISEQKILNWELNLELLAFQPGVQSTIPYRFSYQNV